MLHRLPATAISIILRNRTCRREPSIVTLMPRQPPTLSGALDDSNVPLLYTFTHGGYTAFMNRYFVQGSLLSAPHASCNNHFKKLLKPVDESLQKRATTAYAREYIAVSIQVNVSEII